MAVKFIVTKVVFYKILMMECFAFNRHVMGHKNNNNKIQIISSSILSLESFQLSGFAHYYLMVNLWYVLEKDFQVSP